MYGDYSVSPMVYAMLLIAILSEVGKPFQLVEQSCSRHLNAYTIRLTMENTFFPGTLYTDPLPSLADTILFLAASEKSLMLSPTI